jgi:hypothetical protein
VSKAFSSNGLQMAHEMVLAQWQKVNGKPGREVVWPLEAKSGDLIYPYLCVQLLESRSSGERSVRMPQRNSTHGRRSRSAR